MLPRYTVKPPPPLLRSRDIVHIITLGVFLLFLGYAYHKASDPRTWAWVEAVGPVRQDAKPQAAGLSDAQVLELQFHAGRAVGFLGVYAQPFPNPLSGESAMGGVLNLEHVPLPEHLTKGVADDRKAPIPDPAILGGAEDRQRFLLDNPFVTEENTEHIINERKRRDADARYHLLQLAQAARAEDLAADARSGVRYTALVEKPNEFRGRLIHVEGQLQWIKPFELSRQLPGLAHVYQGVISAGRGDQGYWILFTELPPGFPPEKDWAELYQRDVKFDGYYLKVLALDHPKEKDKRLFVPVLVGKTVELPAAGADKAWPFPIWQTLAGVFGFMVLGSLVMLWLRRGDRAHAVRLEALRKRAHDAALEAERGAARLGGMGEFDFGQEPSDMRTPPGRNGAHP